MEGAELLGKLEVSADGFAIKFQRSAELGNDITAIPTLNEVVKIHGLQVVVRHECSVSLCD